MAAVRRESLLRRGPGIVLLLLAAACASFDAQADLDAAAALASDRVGAGIEWTGAEATASPALPATPISAAMAVDLAVHGHPELRRALAQVAAAKAAWAKAGRLPNPMLEVMVGLPVDGLGGDPWMASLLQPITWLWTRGPRRKRAAAELRAQAMRACELAVAAAAAARTAHARLVFAERGVELARALRATAHAARDVVAERAAVGEATEIERGRAALEALAADDRAAQADLALVQAQQELLAACGAAAAMTPPASDGRLPPQPPVALREADALALARDRFDVQAAVADADAAAAGTRLARRGRWPEVSAGARYERMEDGREVAFPVLAFVPRLFDDGSADVGEAEARARAALCAAESVWQRALGELRVDLARYATARATAQRSREATVPQAQQVSAAADAALAAGVLDPGAAFAARLEALRAEIAADAAALAAAEALYELERDAGVRLVPRGDVEP